MGIFNMFMYQKGQFSDVSETGEYHFCEIFFIFCLKNSF